MTKAILAKKAHQSQEVEIELNKYATLVRVETNFEKLPIWSTKPKRGTTFVSSKLIELQSETLPNGQVVERSIKIVPSAEYGYPTVQTQEYWYALQLLWHDSPTKETGRVEFSRRELIEDILGKTYGRQTRRALDLSINQLATTSFEFRYVFKEQETGITHSELRQFHIISDLRLTERKKTEDVIHDKCSVTLHPLIVSNLRSGYFKPVILSVVSELKSDIARLLYRKIDSQFSHLDRYEISTAKFFKEHGIKGNEYQYPSARKRLLERGIKELIGKPTSKEVSDKSGKTSATIASYQIVKTKDKKDYKLIVRRSSRNASSSKQPRKPQQATNTNLPPKSITPTIFPTQKPREEKQEPSTNNSSLQQLSAETILNSVKGISSSDTSSPSALSSTQNKEQVVEESLSPKVTEKTKENNPQNVSEAAELFTYFDQVFFNSSGVKPSKKEMVEVEKVVTKHGLEKSKFFVDHAYEQSKNALEKPKTFMGILRTIGSADKERLFEKYKSQQATLSSYRVKGEEQREKNAREDYQRKHEPEYHQYILSLKEALMYQYPQELAEFGKWEVDKRQELVEAVENASSQKLWFCKKQLEIFERESLKAIRFVEYFAGHEKIKMPSFWEWDKQRSS